MQIGSDLAIRPLNLGLGLTIYHERMSGVILPVPNTALGTLLAKNAGVISNTGLEGTPPPGSGTVIWGSGGPARRTPAEIAARSIS